jgi:hypothetical protein
MNVSAITVPALFAAVTIAVFQTVGFFSLVGPIVH